MFECLHRLLIVGRGHHRALWHLAWCGGAVSRGGGGVWGGGQRCVDTADTEPELASCLASAPPEPLAASPLCWTQIRGPLVPAPRINSTPHTRPGRRPGAAHFCDLDFKWLYFHFFLVFFLYAKLKFLVRIVFGNADQPSLNFSKMTKKEPVGQDSGRPKRSPSAKLLLLHQPQPTIF